MLRCVAVCCRLHSWSRWKILRECSALQCVAVRTVCCGVLRCVAVCCSVLQLERVECRREYSVLQCVTVCCCVLQRVAGRCRVLQCVAGCYRVLLSWSGVEDRYRAAKTHRMPLLEGIL